MKYLRYIILICFVAVMLFTQAVAQPSNCWNLGFESGSFYNWTGYTWVYSTEHPEATTLPVEGITERRHTIITDVEAYDRHTNNQLKMIPDGYNTSVRLGSPIEPSDPYTGARCWHQTLLYDMDVDSENALLIINFALVLEYAADHLEIEEPHFSFIIRDEQGDTIESCANYNVYASDEDIEGFQFITSPYGDQIMWRDWTTVGINLTPYLGKTVTLEFLSADCTQTYHFGYAYFTASCQPMDISVSNCVDDTVATLTAPAGFEDYTWSNYLGVVQDSSQVLVITDPVEGERFFCHLVSATGCDVTLGSTITKYLPYADFSSEMIDCFSNSVQFNNLSGTNQGRLYYVWDFGEGEEYYENNPLHTFITSGMHQVKLTVFNPPSTCIDVLEMQVESFSPPLVYISEDSTYCPGESVVLYANGAYEYTWSNGSAADSLVISDPGGTYWLHGRSSTGCESDTLYRTVIEEPPWELSVIGDTVFCEGGYTYLSLSGAAEYLWETGDSTNSMVITNPGTYTVFGTNESGCVKSYSFNIEESPLPSSAFDLSTTILDMRNYELEGFCTAEPDVLYSWDMGDGSFASGPEIQHSYTIDYSGELYYTISMTATNIHGCTTTSNEYVDIVPWTPNVFSPNNDGRNDIFMAGLHLQIYDRYGKLLYTGNEGWDGSYNGQPASPDTYFYAIHYSGREAHENILKGYVTLVR